MKKGKGIVILVVLLVAATEEIKGIAAQYSLTCANRRSPCYRRVIRCPSECPVPKPSNPNAKGCFLDCNSPKCEAVCRGRKPNCGGVGAGCYDPRFIGADGVLFYFHGKKGQHFSLVSDPKFQINARFIGLRPAGRTRDFTWIQALGLMFGTHTLAVEAVRASKWDDTIDHLNFFFNGKHIQVPEGHLSEWKSSDDSVKVERTESRNSIMILIKEIAEVPINVVPVTTEDDRIHKYGIPSDDCFVHLEVQFRFLKLSPEVQGVLGQTYIVLDLRTQQSEGWRCPWLVVRTCTKLLRFYLLTASCACFLLQQEAS